MKKDMKNLLKKVFEGLLGLMGLILYSAFIFIREFIKCFFVVFLTFFTLGKISMKINEKREITEDWGWLSLFLFARKLLFL